MFCKMKFSLFLSFGLSQFLREEVSLEEKQKCLHQCPHRVVSFDLIRSAENSASFTSHGISCSKLFAALKSHLSGQEISELVQRPTGQFVKGANFVSSRNCPRQKGKEQKNVPGVYLFDYSMLDEQPILEIPFDILVLCTARF